MVKRTSVRPGPEGLRALSHPGRLRMLGLLRHEGPATATTLANRLGLNTGATSYHLRQLAKHGFVVEDEERGNARDRWWRAAHQSTRVDSTDVTTPEDHDTYDAFMQSVAILYGERLQASVEERRLLPEEWQAAGTLSDWHLRLTPERAKELVERLDQIVESWDEDPEDDPRAAPFSVNLNAYLRPGTLPRWDES